MRKSFLVLAAFVLCFIIYMIGYGKGQADSYTKMNDDVYYGEAKKN